MKNNPYLLQVAEVVNADADLTAYTTKINEDDDNMDIPYKEYQKKVEYQETLKIKRENIEENIKKI